MAELAEQTANFNLFVVGNPKEGKSTFCNFFFREEKFKENTTLLRMRNISTEQVIHDTFYYKGSSITFFDCPGIDFQGESFDVYDIIRKAGDQVNNKVDAFVFMVRLSRRLQFTLMYNFLKTFGSNIWNHVFIVFTNEQIITEKEAQPAQPGGRQYVEEWLAEPNCTPLILEAMENIKRRYICIECKDWNDNEEYWNGKCQELVEMLNKVKAENNGEPFDHTQLIDGLELFKTETQKRKREDELIDRVERARTRIRDLNKCLSQPDPVIPLYDIVTSPSLLYLWIRAKLMRNKKTLIEIIMGGSISLLIFFLTWKYINFV